jgi:hypothetical protein
LVRCFVLLLFLATWDYMRDVDLRQGDKKVMRSGKITNA